MRVDLHEDGVEALVDDWAELFASDDRATPFQSPRWGRALWRWWPDQGQSWVVAVRDAGQLIGLAPLVLHRTGALRILRVLGEEPGDYWDVLALPARRGAVQRAVATELHRRRDQWDLAVIAGLPERTTTTRALAGSGLSMRGRPAVPCPGIDLPGSFEEYLASLPTKRRTDLRRRLRNLDDGTLAVREVAVAELPAALERWQAIRARQWSAREGVLHPLQASDRYRDFLVDALAALVPEGLALVWEFLHDDNVVGVYINFCDAGTFYQYLGGFEPELSSLAIGKVATAHGLRSSIAAGRRYYDFARGAEPYKYDYGAVDRLSPSVVLSSGRLRSKAALTITSSATALERLARAHTPASVRAVARPLLRRLRERR
jgi:CelD/BcsL family acetyltransferase involved in cellulose biosynthesis